MATWESNPTLWCFKPMLSLVSYVALSFCKKKNLRIQSFVNKLYVDYGKFCSIAFLRFPLLSVARLKYLSNALNYIATDRHLRRDLYSDSSVRSLQLKGLAPLSLTAGIAADWSNVYYIRKPCGSTYPIFFNGFRHLLHCNARDFRFYVVMIGIEPTVHRLRVCCFKPIKLHVR